MTQLRSAADCSSRRGLRSGANSTRGANTRGRPEDGFLGPHSLTLGLLGESPGSHRNNPAANRLVEPVGTGATHAVCLLLLPRLLQLLQHVLDRGVHARPVARAAFFATRLSPAPVFRTALFADLMAFVVLEFLRLAFFMIPPVPRFVQLGSFFD